MKVMFVFVLLFENAQIKYISFHVGKILPTMKFYERIVKRKKMKTNKSI